MKELKITGDLKVLAFNAMKTYPNGYKGLDNIRTGLKLMEKLEEGLPTDRKLQEEEIKKEYNLNLEEKEVKLLKDCLETMPWNGNFLKQVIKLSELLEDKDE